ncbi:YbaB/EbfC family nucleoid-associated protein [Catenuloplanes sp. NPDC051500]|uniref:YbaB/EbfC family nucleoid-associated protein n=1 Tax=Catenuloplanes sp. NPDC051500 TaxID=3363959 RepID=UPI0037AD80D1
MAIEREAAELEGALAEARRMLGAARSAAPDADQPPVEGRGEAQDGLVVVSAGAGGRIAGVRLDAQLRRLTFDEIAAAVTVAVNAALDDAAAQAGAAAGAAPDLVALTAQVERVQDEGMRQMARFTGALTDVMNRLGSRP